MPYRPEGDLKNAEIVFVGEAPSTQEMLQGRPLVGPSGHVFNECLAKAGILRSNGYLTNVFYDQVRKQKGKSHIYNQRGELLYSDTKAGFTEAAQSHLQFLQEQLAASQANVIVAMGGPAFRAICDGRGITKWRGSILPATMQGIEKRKVIPTVHPAMALHGQYINRYLITADFKRAAREKDWPEIHRPAYNFRLYPTFRDCLDLLKSMRSVEAYACDIEVGYMSQSLEPKGQITRICYAWSDTEAISIPYADGNWTLEQEAELWYETALTLETKGPLKIFHNGTFDIQVLYQIHGVWVAPPYADTMVAHHVVYPDFRKSLAFCASLHTDQPYWKDMVKHFEIENPEG